MENHHFDGKIHYKWPFPIATLNYQRVLFLKSSASFRWMIRILHCQVVHQFFLGLLDDSRSYCRQLQQRSLYANNVHMYVYIYIRNVIYSIYYFIYNLSYIIFFCIALHALIRCQLWPVLVSSTWPDAPALSELPKHDSKGLRCCGRTGGYQTWA